MKIHLQFPIFTKSNFFLLLLAGMILNSSISEASDYKYSNSWGQAGYTVELQSHSKVIINYSIDLFSLKEKEIDGEIYQYPELPGHFLPNEAGSPNLPSSGKYIALPQGSEATLKIISYRTDTINHVNVAPSFRIPFDTDNGPLDYTKNESIYSSDKFFPEKPVVLSNKDVIRGVDVIMLGVTPFQYNPATKQLIVYRDLKIEVGFIGGNGHFAENRLRSRWWDPMMSDMLLNFESLPKMNYNRSFQGTDETGFEYLIIIPNATEFQVWADSIKKFRTTQGILTGVVTLNQVGGNSASIIENYINNAYATWDIPPAACLLLGDYGTDASNRIISPLWNNYCVSDNVYADINGNDLPDIVFARITAQDAAQLEVMVTKFLDYERIPPASPEFYDHPITSLGWQSDSWFQLCSEVIGGFWREAQGKNPVRINDIYSGTPGTDWSTAPNTQTLVDYFGPNGLGYIPLDPTVLGGWTGGTADMINTAIDSGAFMVQHRDHGVEEGWGEPAYTITNINNLLNTKLTFVWSVNCLTGKFNYSTEVFAEKLHRYTHKDENSGCFGMNAATEITYSFLSDVYVWGAYDNMWSDFLPGFGSTPLPRGVLPAIASAAGKYFLEQSAWPSLSTNKDATYHLFHHHGDAFTTVYSEVPQMLTVSHSAIIYLGETTFDVTADVDALIGLSVNGELIGTGTGTGAPVSITIPVQAPPDQVLVTVTKQNYYRYESFVDVLPATGPYVVYNNYTINDASGNGNGIMETSESILASITVKNVGVEDADNIVVTINTTDDYVQITDNNEIYGTINAGSTAVIADGFSWDVTDSIPDMHIVLFEITASDGLNSWTSNFSIIGHAPLLEFGNMTIDDYIGNFNARLDPGETAFLVMPVFNNGSYNAASTIGNISCTNEYITLNNSTYNFYDIGAGLTEEAIFNITVSNDAPAGAYIEFLYEVTSGGYSNQQLFSTLISPVVEDWETGDMTQFEWTTGGDADWDISIDNPYEGSFCVKSGTITHDQNSYISVEYEVFGDDSLSFWYKVSSETGYDYLRFYIDDVEFSSWSGEVAWQRASFPVSTGLHTFKWAYIKDETLSSGNDCGWIDYIVFPIASFQAAFNSDETAICVGESVSYFDQSSGDVISWDWTFEGGTPGTSTQQNPVILYSAEGTYDVSLTVSDGSLFHTLALDDYVTVSAMPDTPPAPSGPASVCASEISTSYSTTGLTGISVYEWVLEPSAAGNVTGTGLTATIVWTNGFMGDVTLKVAGQNDCGTGGFSMPFDINRYLPDVTLEPFDWVCIGWPAFELTGGLPDGGEYSGPGIENGWFTPSLAGLGTHTITYTYTDPEGCENFTTETILVDPCTGISDMTSDSGIKIYPNPTSGLINIEFRKDIGILDVKVFNILNSIIYSEQTETSFGKKLNIDLSHLDKGVYFIKLKSDSTEKMIKIILR